MHWISRELREIGHELPEVREVKHLHGMPSAPEQFCRGDVDLERDALEVYEYCLLGSASNIG